MPFVTHGEIYFSPLVASPLVGKNPIPISPPHGIGPIHSTLPGIVQGFRPKRGGVTVYEYSPFLFFLMGSSLLIKPVFSSKNPWFDKSSGQSVLKLMIL